MSLKILIGTNKTGKSSYLEKERENFEKEPENKSLYLSVGNDINEFIKSDNLGTKSKPIKTPIVKLIEFINEIHSITIVVELKDDDDEKRKEVSQKGASFIENKFLPLKDDILFENEMLDVIKSNENEWKKNIKFDFIKWNFPDRNFSKNFSSGTTNYSYFKLIVHFLELEQKQIKDDKTFHLFIDEPEIFCHPELINKVASEIYKISKIINVTIATHSPVLLNKIVQLKNYDSDKNTQVDIKYFFKTEKGVFNDPKDIHLFNLNGLNPREWEKLTESLFSTNIILYEGINDFLFLHDVFYNYKKEYFAEKYITFIDCSCRNDVEKMAKKLTELKLDKHINILMFYDLDFDKVSAEKFNGKDYLVGNTKLKPKKEIVIKANDSVKSIIQKPDLECELFKLSSKREYKLKNNKIVTKSDLKDKMTIKFILENSPYGDIEQIIDDKISKLKNWIEKNDKFSSE